MQAMCSYVPPDTSPELRIPLTRMQNSGTARMLQLLRCHPLPCSIRTHKPNASRTIGRLQSLLCYLFPEESKSACNSERRRNLPHLKKGAGTTRTRGDSTRKPCRTCCITEAQTSTKSVASTKSTDAFASSARSSSAFHGSGSKASAKCCRAGQ